MQTHKFRMRMLGLKGNQTPDFPIAMTTRRDTQLSNSSDTEVSNTNISRPSTHSLDSGHCILKNY